MCYPRLSFSLLPLMAPPWPCWTLLHWIAHVSYPSYQIVEVLIQCMEWNLMTSQRSIPFSKLPGVHQAAVNLLVLLKKNLPDKCGEASGWSFKKAHSGTAGSIVHNVLEIVLLGNSDKGAGHTHIELIKSVAHLTNNKDVFYASCNSTL